MGLQPDWRWCDRCYTLAYSGFSGGTCFAAHRGQQALWRGLHHMGPRSDHAEMGGLPARAEITAAVPAGPGDDRPRHRAGCAL